MLRASEYAYQKAGELDLRYCGIPAELDKDRWFRTEMGDFRHWVAHAPTNALARYELGLALWTQGNLAEAREQFEEAARIEPAFSEARRALADVVGAAGDSHGRLRVYMDLLADRPELVDVRTNAAVLLMRAGRLEDAVRHLRCALEWDPESRLTLFNLGLALASLGHWHDSELIARRLLTQSPRDVAVRYLLFRALVEANEISKARKECDGMRDIAPSHELSIMASAELALTVGEYELALLHYRNILEKDPQNEGAAYGAALALDRWGHRTAACRQYRRVLALNPTHTKSMNNLAVLLRQSGSTSEALTLLETAVQLAPEDFLLLFNLGFIHASIRSWMPARRCFEKSAELNPSHFGVNYNLAFVLGKVNRPSEAVRYYRRALELNGDSADAELGLGAALVRLGELEEALAALRSAEVKERSSPHPAYHIATVLESVNDLEGARRELAACLTKDPDHIRARLSLMRLDLRSGRLIAVCRDFQQLVLSLRRLWRSLG